MWEEINKLHLQFHLEWTLWVLLGGSLCLRRCGAEVWGRGVGCDASVAAVIYPGTADEC